MYAVVLHLQKKSLPSAVFVGTVVVTFIMAASFEGTINLLKEQLLVRCYLNIF